MSNLPVFDEIVEPRDQLVGASADGGGGGGGGGRGGGSHTGQVKWWNDKLGFGFATICDEGPDRGRDVFVHHTGIRPANVGSYRTLRKGEYVSFNITMGLNGQQAIDVTGVGGGMLMCDVNANGGGSRL